MFQLARRSFRLCKPLKPFMGLYYKQQHTFTTCKPKNKLLNNVINTLACTLLSIPCITATYMYFKYGDNNYITSIYPMSYAIYTIANENNMYFTIFVFSAAFIIIAPIILYIKYIC